MKQAISDPKLPCPTGAYSAGIRAGDLVFVSGQGPVDPVTGKIVGRDIEAQTRRTLENIRLVLEAAGARMDDCVKLSVHLADIADFERFNAVYATFFDDPKPTRTTVQSTLEEIRVEIDAVAYCPQE